MKEQVSPDNYLVPSIYIFFVDSETVIFVPRGSVPIGIFINVFFFVNLSQTEVLRGADA